MITLILGKVHKGNNNSVPTTTFMYYVELEVKYGSKLYFFYRY